MAAQKLTQRRDSLEKLLVYILGHQPDEFGLYPDEEGFVAVKDLTAALRDEDGFRGLRETQIFELADRPGGATDFDLTEDRQLIRLKPNLASLPPEAPDLKALPKSLYFPLKPQVWLAIGEKGFAPKYGEKYSKFWASKEMAQKLGRRLSHDPVIITLNTAAVLRDKVIFKPYSELLWLSADQIAPAALTGPPIPQKSEAELLEAAGKKARKLEKKQADERDAGGFYMPSPDPQVHHGKVKGRYGDSPDWKNQVRRERRRHDKDTGDDDE